MRIVNAEYVKFDSTRKIREDADSLVVPAIFTRESILPFNDGRGYRPAKELEDAAWTLEGAWVVTYDHILTVFPMSREDIRGRVENVKFDVGIQGIKGDIRFIKALCDQALLDNVKQGNLKDVSVAYFSEDVFESGKFAGEPYDFIQRNFMFGHVAAGVPEGRCPSPFCGMNVDSFKPHKDPEETEDFIHIPVRDADLFVDGSFRTIDIDADKGIKAVIGKLKSDPKGSTVVQKFIFDKDKDWTMEKAKAWIAEHKDSVESMNLEGIKKKLKDLENQRTTIMEKLYPKSQLSEEEQQKLREELTVLDAETKAYIEFLAEKLSMIIESGAAGSAIQAQPRDVVARAKNHFNLSDEQWNALSEEEKQKLISQLPPVGTQRQNAKDTEWTTEYVNNLADECFAYIEEGGKKDDEGKTVPRSLRHLEFKNAQGEIDHDHLIAALQALSGARTGKPLPYAEKAKPKLCAAVRSWNREHEEAKIESEVCGTEDSACSPLDPYEELARSHKYFHSNMSLFGTE